MRKKNLFFQCVSVALFAATLTGCSSKGGEQQNAAGQQQTAYQFLTVEKGERTLDQAYSATIRGRQDVAIMPQVGGTIKQVCVTEGQQVHAGQTLFIIDQVPFQAALRTAEANVKAAKAQLATAKLNYESNQELFRQQVVSQHTLTTAENAYLTAQAGLAQAQARHDTTWHTSTGTSRNATRARARHDCGTTRHGTEKTKIKTKY